MKKTFMALALCAFALVPALGFVNNASASDGSSIHSTLQQDHMLTPWALDMQKEASR
ncbi:MAG TPA: hypothetical protein H9962_04320 [Candidatus Mailhella merdigallinarum]|uniref:Uncharacterized protein n=1 Tax=Candidatus Mailhella merdigallinarum TaxID=2838658 RepID=A0A9D2KL57_9BACT|nr:hypothetical protein [Candidatus Mailhella merdigallinarum]